LTPVHPIPLFPAVVLAVLAGQSARTAVPAFDRNDVLGSIRRLQRSRAPEARAIVWQIENGPRDLALQRAAARGEGIPLTPAQLKAAAPPPAALNAAPVYEELAQMLKAKPVDLSTLQIVGRLGADRSTTPDELAAVRKMLEKRQDAIDLVHQATERPRCVFRSDWSHGPPLLFREFTTLRAARLLQAESFLQAQEGRWNEAITTQARGFRVAEHAATDSFLIGYLIGTAIDRITLVGMANILDRAGPNAEVAERVRSTIAASRPQLDFRRTLESEGVFSLVNLEELRHGGPQKMAGWLSMNVDLEFNHKARRASAKPHALTSQERRMWDRLIDSAEASYIQRLRRIIASGGATYAARAALLKQMDRHDKAQPNNPLCRIYWDEYSVIAGTNTQRERQCAREDAVMAGAALLAYRAHHAAFPDRLEEAMSVPPLDPFSGQFLKYRREGDGFAVFSVGAEGAFGGGEPGTRIDTRQVYFRYPALAAGSTPGDATP
jgi:hypothetical protein